MIWGIILGVIIRQETLQFEIYIFWRFLIGRNEQSQFHKKSQIVITISQHNTISFLKGVTISQHNTILFLRGVTISQHNTIFFQAYFTTLINKV